MPSKLFVKACMDTKTAWVKTGLPSMLKQSKVERLRTALAEGDAKDISKLFMEISYAPFSGAAANFGIDDAKASRLSCLLLEAMFIPYVRRRVISSSIDLEEVKCGLIEWIDTGELPSPYRSDAGDLRKITELIANVPARLALTAPFAAPLEFSIQALATISQTEGIRHVANH